MPENERKYSPEIMKDLRDVVIDSLFCLGLNDPLNLRMERPLSEYLFVFDLIDCEAILTYDALKFLWNSMEVACFRCLPD